MFSKLVLTLAAVIAIVSSLSAAGKLSQIICDDLYCKVNCRANMSFPTGTCVQNPENKSQSAIFNCMKIPGQTCYTSKMYNFSQPGADTCNPAALTNVFTQTCNKCNTNDGKPNTASITICTESTITTKYQCDDTCTTCKDTYSYPTKTCKKYSGYYSAPFPCTEGEKGQEWDNSGSCNGANPTALSAAVGTCSGWVDATTGKTTSIMAQCS